MNSCNVIHRRGSKAEKTCPVHGHRQTHFQSRPMAQQIVLGLQPNEGRCVLAQDAEPSDLVDGFLVDFVSHGRALTESDMESAYGPNWFQVRQAAACVVALSQQQVRMLGLEVLSQNYGIARSITQAAARSAGRNPNGELARLAQWSANHACRLLLAVSEDQSSLDNIASENCKDAALGWLLSCQSADLVGIAGLEKEHLETLARPMITAYRDR